MNLHAMGARVQRWRPLALHDANSPSMMALSLSRILLAGWRTRVNPLGNRQRLQLGARDERRRPFNRDSQQHRQQNKTRQPLRFGRCYLRYFSPLCNMHG